MIDQEYLRREMRRYVAKNKITVREFAKKMELAYTNVLKIMNTDKEVSSFYRDRIAMFMFDKLFEEL